MQLVHTTRIDNYQKQNDPLFNPRSFSTVLFLCEHLADTHNHLDGSRFGTVENLRMCKGNLGALS